MNPSQGRRNGGKVLVDQLVIQGVERISCVPGESYLAALDAMLDVASISTSAVDRCCTQIKRNDNGTCQTYNLKLRTTIWTPPDR